MLKIEGLDKLTRELDKAQKAFAEIDGELGSVNLNPEDPASIEAAIRSVEQMIDSRLGSYANNRIVAPMIPQLKEHYREVIIDKVAKARLENGVD